MSRDKSIHGNKQGICETTYHQDHRGANKSGANRASLRQTTSQKLDKAETPSDTNQNKPEKRK